MKEFQTFYLNESLKYDGTQLRPLWIYKNFDLQGHSMVAFQGACDVELRNMVDVEDIKLKSPIYSEKMLHFLLEFFEVDLEKSIYRQRLLMVIIKETLEERLGRILKRHGDDIYDRDKKMTVSIATMTPVSTLIHCGINISSKNTPIPTKGLEDLDIPPERFAKDILERFQTEMESSWMARCKVRPIT